MYKFTVEDQNYLYYGKKTPKTLDDENVELLCELCSALIGIRREGQRDYYVVTDDEGGEHVLCGRCQSFMERGQHVE